jgi:hypothetical protein
MTDGKRPAGFVGRSGEFAERLVVGTATWAPATAQDVLGRFPAMDPHRNCPLPLAFRVPHSA